MAGLVLRTITLNCVTKVSMSASVRRTIIIKCHLEGRLGEHHNYSGKNLFRKQGGCSKNLVYVNHFEFD